MRPLGGHLGADVSALVDDQLPVDEAERRWSHVQECTTCLDAVQQELWVKNRLHAAPSPVPPRLPDPALTAALAGLHQGAARTAARSRRGPRRAGVVAVGVGTVSAALTGVVLFTGAQATPGPEPTVVDRQPPALQPGTTFRRPPGASAQLPTP